MSTRRIAASIAAAAAGFFLSGCNLTQEERPVEPSGQSVQTQIDPLDVSTNRDFDKDQSLLAGIRVLADNIYIDCHGHTLTGSNGTGVEIANRRNITIRNCVFDGYYDGIAITRGHTISVINCRFRNIFSTAIKAWDYSEVLTFSRNDVTARYGNGILLQNAFDITASGNNVYNCVTGVFIVLSGTSRWTNNTIHHNALQGIAVAGSANGTYEGNRVHDNQDAGMYIYRYQNIRSQNNYVTDLEAFGNKAGGLRITSSTDTFVSGLWSYSNTGNGIRIEGCVNTWMTYSNVCGNSTNNGYRVNSTGGGYGYNTVCTPRSPSAASSWGTL